MANQSTQKYIDGEKDWITAMLASQPIVEGKSSEQVEKLLIQEIKEPEEIDIDPDIEKEIAELQEKKLDEEKKEFVQESIKTVNIEAWIIKEDTLKKIEADIDQNYKEINKVGFIKYMNREYFIDQEFLDKVVKNFKNVNIFEDQIAINLNDEAVDNETYEDIKKKLGETLEVNKLEINQYDKESIKSLFLNEKIYRISKNIIIADLHLNILIKHLEKLPLEFSVSEFKDQTELSRKYAIPMLELLDKKLITSKINDSGDRKKLV